MHVPDGFLSTPVWLTLDAAAIPAVAYAARKASVDASDAKAPLLGVMGAFVFAAQMVNFPVGLGSSGHLLGAALLTYTLGPAAAAMVLTAIIGLQALLFQDGGVLAMGANVINMAFAGVLVAAVPLWLNRNRPIGAVGIFTGASLSVLVTGCLALVELFVSGVTMPAPVTGLTLFLFAVTGVLEGFITLAVMGGLHRIHPRWTAAPEPAASRRTVALVAAGALLLVTLGVVVASSSPDSLQHLAGQVGLAAHAPAAFPAPMANYQAPLPAPTWLRESAAGITGAALIFVAFLMAGLTVTRKRSA